MKLFTKIKRSRVLAIVLGLGFIIFSTHYILFEQAVSPIHQGENNKQIRELNQQSRDTRQEKRKTFGIDFARDFKISDIILPAGQKSSAFNSSKPSERIQPQVDNPKPGSPSIHKQSEQKPQTENQNNNVAKNVPLQSLKQENKIPGNVEQESGKQNKKLTNNVALQPTKQENKEFGNTAKQSEQKIQSGNNKADDQASKSTQVSKNSKGQLKHEKFLIYLCDEKVGCYGLGDRQRAMVATYYLAGLTGRRFGLIMTSPANFREFYEPNVPKWDVKMADLPKNASRIEIKAHGGADLHLDKLDFNTVYPQDIVFMRTNHVFWHNTLKNRVYDAKIPEWARIPKGRLFPEGLVRLMKPTPVLRVSLNKVLVSIAEKLQEESDVRKILEKTACCKKRQLPASVPVCAGNRTLCAGESSTQACCDKLTKNMFSGCPELRETCSVVDFQACADHLRSASSTRWNGAKANILAHTFCSMPPSISKLNGTIDSIRNKKGFDLTDMNLMCAHIRMGHSKTLPFENVAFNKPADITGIWDFLKKFAAKGYHMYLASDAQEVKDEAKTIFGERLHMMENKIVHIDRERKTQADEAKNGLKFTLTEQLLLATSCREIVRSHSGYSMRATEIRQKLMNYHTGHVYRFHNGIVE